MATEDIVDDAVEVGVSGCLTDADCAALAGCCLEAQCREGQCVPTYVPDCCVEPGPCAVDTPLHGGLCETPCEAFGCARRLALSEDECGQEIWSMGPDPLPQFTPVESVSGRVFWHPDPRRPFDGRPSLRVGDVLCPTYHDGPHDADCRPIGESRPVRAGLEGEWFTLPQVAAVAELALWVDVDPSPTTDRAIDGLDLFVVEDTGASHQVWSSRPLPLYALAVPVAPVPQRTWTPVIVDLSRWAGTTVRLRLVFDTLDGRENDREGVALGRLRVRTPCPSERSRETLSALTACEQVTSVPVYPLADALLVSLPPADTNHRGCSLCSAASQCELTGDCEMASCEAGYCRVMTQASCCEMSPTWNAAPGFESPLEGWETTGPWQVSDLRAESGTYTLHFGMPDGSGLAPGLESAEGEAKSPVMRVPDEAPVWSFSLWLSTEWDGAPSVTNPAGVDLLEALVWLDRWPALPAMVVWSSSEVGGTTSVAWERIAVDLKPWRGLDVRLGWRFRTGDSEMNSPGAVFIDRPLLRESCPGCGARDEMDGACAPHE